MSCVNPTPSAASVVIRVKGTVQGVGFRPAVWRLARKLSLTGEVSNDGEGVLIEVAGDPRAIEHFLAGIRTEVPPLCRIEAIETLESGAPRFFSKFSIVASSDGDNRTRVTPDAGICDACSREILDASQRRFSYPFTNCTHCGPRFSIIRAVPYDRKNTTMDRFAICSACLEEYSNPADRRFHAQPIACPVCGPGIWLETPGGSATGKPDADGARALIARCGESLKKGLIIAVRGLGGFHLCCDATNSDTVERLRARKHRYAKPFALMADSIDVIRRYCHVNEQEQGILQSMESPIVLLKRRRESPSLSGAISPGSDLLGFMLPYTPLHRLLAATLETPLVMTSGNLSDDPQIIDNDTARVKLKGIADLLLLHDREIQNRIDDSVVRVMADRPRVLRRARGYAPRTMPLPAGFRESPSITAYGGQLKATFCLLTNDGAVVSQHQGDLENVATFDDYEKNLSLYTRLFSHRPVCLAADLHPDYLSTKLASQAAAERGIPLIEVQHHHAHIASCLLENGVPLRSRKVLGIALDGLGFGDDGTIWGGEFLLADYRSYTRLGTFMPTPMIGGTMAIREPWRNTYAHLVQSLGWERLAADFGNTDLFQYLEAKPIEQLRQMVMHGLNVPLASSCGRLYDAVSGALGLCADRAWYEGQAAVELETLAASASGSETTGYSFDVIRNQTDGLFVLDPSPMWLALLIDLAEGLDKTVMAQRFEAGLVNGILDMVLGMSQAADRENGFDTVALSGGCFQNRLLLEGVATGLQHAGYTCLTHVEFPPNDGGLSLGQAAVASATISA